MEISLRTNLMIATLVPKLRKTISCRANEFAVQRKNTNFYEVLSLRSENVGFDEIKKAYRNLALQCHPDLCPPSAKEDSTRRFVEVRKAYETLSDPISRKVYDYKLGLVESMGSDADGVLFAEERKPKFSKQVWESQLYGLKKRSQARMNRKRYGYM
ncbi:chaperone protein dnaJ 20, chloroplastic-like [Alnus glutinosa]|uniref:chaperone protein dnaJ 20, chloroplastic-like n=1 Tax=Alnus glutinosa TaxID=3517 RepID=UPI002D7695D0|nr:chaperone protein dnaJ 20, chloroplastic-like [Alnus glutinosa]